MCFRSPLYPPGEPAQMKAAENTIFDINITGKGRGFNCKKMYGECSGLSSSVA